jgi:hypothetical protein
MAAPVDASVPNVHNPFKNYVPTISLTDRKVQAFAFIALAGGATSAAYYFTVSLISAAVTFTASSAVILCFKKTFLSEVKEASQTQDGKEDHKQSKVKEKPRVTFAKSVENSSPPKDPKKASSKHQHRKGSSSRVSAVPGFPQALASAGATGSHKSKKRRSSTSHQRAAGMPPGMPQNPYFPQGQFQSSRGAPRNFWGQ